MGILDMDFSPSATPLPVGFRGHGALDAARQLLGLNHRGAIAEHRHHIQASGENRIIYA
jgi:hypothetical protein